jgi:hypothetical protein
MKAWLSKAAVQLREQTDDCFPDRKRASDGWIGDARHSSRVRKHNPNEQVKYAPLTLTLAFLTKRS